MEPVACRELYRILVCVCLFLFSVGPVTAGEWEYKAEVYLYMPEIEGTLPTGRDIKISVDDLFDNLDMTFLGVFQAQKDDWALVSDIQYLKLSFDEAGDTTLPVGPLSIPTQVDIGVDLEGWWVNLAGAYRVYQGKNFDVQLLAGARYMSLDAEAELDVSILPGQVVVDEKDDVWDAIIGVRGLWDMNEKWWMSYRFDVGSGDSDKTWSAAAQFAYKYDWGSLAFGYRHQHYDFNSDFKLMKDLDVGGPFIGAAWQF
jgi:hypothetical protein